MINDQVDDLINTIEMLLTTKSFPKNAATEMIKKKVNILAKLAKQNQEE
jgi:hypothetical protein